MDQERVRRQVEGKVTPGVEKRRWDQDNAGPRSEKGGLVLRLFRGEPLNLLSRDLRVEIYRL